MPWLSGVVDGCWVACFAGRCTTRTKIGNLRFSMISGPLNRRFGISTKDRANMSGKEQYVKNYV
eukprot:261042-Amphidinium_carterae.1